MINKKRKSISAQGHIEIILSFVIFLGFLIMIFVFFNPIKSPQTSTASLDDAQEKILNYLSVDYDYIPLIIKINPQTITEACFSVTNPINNFVDNYMSFIILDQNNTPVKSRASSTDIYITKSLTTGNKLYKIYLSRNDDTFNRRDYFFTESCTALTTTPAQQYSFGSLTSDKLVFYDRLGEFNFSYMNGYEQLKQNLDLADDFEFIVYDKNRNVIMNESLSMHKLKTTTVLSRELLLKTINQNATQGDIIFALRVW
jgi:hypothetical protein